jgi:ACS family pantothenate transporter-like MFS transporter
MICRTFNNSGGSTPVFAQFLKDSKNPKYTVAEINDYPTGTYAVQVVSTLAYAWVSDSVLYVSLAVWDIPMGWKWTCYYIVGCGYGLSGLIMA